MPFCPNCGNEISETASFCPNCGNETKKQTSYCSNCGNELNPGATFCGNCGRASNKNKSTTYQVKPKRYNSSFKISFDKQGIRNFFENISINSQSKTFIIFVALFMGLGAGLELWFGINEFLPDSIYAWSDASEYLYRFAIVVLIAIISGIFSFFILRKREEIKLRKNHKVLDVIWMSGLLFFLLLNIDCIINYITKKNYYFYYFGAVISKYIIYPNAFLAIIIVSFIISAVLITYKDKSRFPIVLFLSFVIWLLIDCVQQAFILIHYISSTKIQLSFQDLIYLLFNSGIIYIIFLLLCAVSKIMLPKKHLRWVISCLTVIMLVFIYVKTGKETFADLIDYINDKPFDYGYNPWSDLWNLVVMLLQTLSVLMLSLSFENKTTEKINKTIETVEKNETQKSREDMNNVTKQ